MHESKKAEGAAAVADIEEFADGLVCLTGGDEGMLASALVQGGETEDRQFVERLVSMFGHSTVYVELHLCNGTANRSRNGGIRPP